MTQRSLIERPSGLGAVAAGNRPDTGVADKRRTSGCHGGTSLARGQPLTIISSEQRINDTQTTSHHQTAHAHAPARGLPGPSGTFQDGGANVRMSAAVSVKGCCRRIVRDTPRQARSPSATVVRPGLGLTTSPLLQRATPSVDTRDSSAGCFPPGRPSDRQGDTRSALSCTVTLRLDMDDHSAEVSTVVTSHGTRIAVLVDVDRPSSTVEVPHDMPRLRGNRMRDRRQTGCLLPLTARLRSRADTQHATTTAVDATGPATIRSSRPPRPATTRSRQETSVQPRNHGPGLRITRGYRSYSARVGDGQSQSHIDDSAPRARRGRADAAGSGSNKARPEILKQERAFRSQIK